MNQYMITMGGEQSKHYGPFKTAGAAAKWANKHLRGYANAPANWVILRLFSPK